MARFYLPPEAWNGPAWELEGEEARHALRVMRLHEGDSCTVFDGLGRAAEVRILSTEGSSHLTLEPTTFLPQAPDTAAITLCQSIPKGSNMDLIVQKAVEMGVSRIVPLVTERTIVRLTPQEAEAKTKKWRRTALEACKQCGQNTLPAVERPMPYREFIATFDGPGVNLHAALTPEARSLRGVLEGARAEGVREASLLIGPEGDFTPEENAAAAERGFVPVTFGPIVLRVETASFLGIAAIRYALD